MRRRELPAGATASDSHRANDPAGRSVPPQQARPPFLSTQARASLARMPFGRFRFSRPGQSTIGEGLNGRKEGIKPEFRAGDHLESVAGRRTGFPTCPTCVWRCRFDRGSIKRRGLSGRTPSRVAGFLRNPKQARLCRCNPVGVVTFIGEATQGSAAKGRRTLGFDGETLSAYSIQRQSARTRHAHLPPKDQPTNPGAGQPSSSQDIFNEGAFSRHSSGGEAPLAFRPA